MHGHFFCAQCDCFGAQVSWQVVVPAPRVVLEEAPRHAELIGDLMQLVARVGQQMAELAEAQPGLGITSGGVDVGGHGGCVLERRSVLALDGDEQPVAD